MKNLAVENNLKLTGDDNSLSCLLGSDYFLVALKSQ